MIRFATSVWVERPIEDVFAYVSDPEKLPDWNSAVRTVRKTSAGEDEVGSRYSLERDLPTGVAVNDLEVTVHEPPDEFALRTLSGPTPFVFRYAFSRSERGTLVKLDAEVELSGVAALAGPLARRAVTRGVDDNFRTLKHVLETRSTHG